MTLARISIEAGAWTDPRFAMLAKLLGLADAEHALIRCARVWAWQTDQYRPDAPTYVVAADLLDALIAPGAGAAMVRVGLAEELPEGFRIRGSEGRIEWLANRRRSAKAGGRAKASASHVALKREDHYNTGTYSHAPASCQMAPNCKEPQIHKPHGNPSGLPRACQNPALLSGSPDIARPLSGSVGSGLGQVGPELPDLGPTRDRVQAGDPRVAEQARLLRVIGAEHRAAHARMRQELGFDTPGGKSYVPAMQALGDPAERALRELLAAQVTLEGFEERARHVLAVAEHEARHADPPSLRWFGASLWSPGSFGRAVAMAVGEDRRPPARAATPVRESLTAKSLRRVAELEALEREEEQRAVDASAL